MLEAEHVKFNGTYRFVIHRVQKYFPHMLLSYIVMIVVLKYQYAWTIKETLYQFIYGMNEIFFLKAITYYNGVGINGVTWYLSSLLICGVIIYYLLCNHRKLYIELIAPISICLIYAYLIQEVGTVGANRYINGLVHELLLRGFAAMSIGCIAYIVVKKLDSNKISNRSAFMMANFSMLLIFLTMLRENYQEIHAFFLLPIMSIGTGLACYCKLPIYVWYYVKKMEKYTYAIYLNHCVVRIVVHRFFEYNMWTFILYCVLITVYSIITQKLLERLINIYQYQEKLEK